ncbi:hypothetical protein EB72_08395 [Mycobacterium sp. SWH-M1]|nr:hypothetical protein EB72_08395 [Mycobacterium sp. SWH-M1]
MGFRRERVIELVTEFYRSHDADEGTKYLVIANLDDAIQTAMAHGPESRLTQATTRRKSWPVQELDSRHHRGPSDVHGRLLARVVERDDSGVRQAWLLQTIVLTAGTTIGQQPGPLREACHEGLGWLILARRTAIIVPNPVMRFAEGQPGVLHDDTGRMAVVWPDGHGYYFLHGIEFDKRLYFQVIDHQLLIQDIAALDNADQRAIALQYLTFEQLVTDSDAELLDRGVRGTALYRLELPPRLARDRKPDHGRYDYFIHMRDASHPEREFIEWVDPDIGKQRHAELCQAHAFGISLDEWLSIEQEG